jgi:tetratricopeptide (TPR) repeat protein
MLQAKEASPFKPSVLVLNNIAMGYTLLGRYEEARKWIPMITNPVTRERREVCLSLALADWTSADRILAGGQLKSRSPETADRILASLDAARGALRKAARRYESSLEQTKTDNDYAFGNCFRMMHIFEIAGIRDVTLNVSACTDTTVPGLVVDGFRAAFANDTSSASLCLDAIRRKPAYLQRKYTTDIVLLDARIAAAKGEWEKVAERLEPLSRAGKAPGFSGRLPIRWLVAEAYEKTGRIERAAESYEGVLSPVKLSDITELYEFPAYCSFAHYRLVHLYSQLGKEVESRRHYDAFRAIFTEPDPELAPMLEEARLAVTTSEKR